jgi:GNAT superfamily N-acetyltransferase
VALAHTVVATTVPETTLDALFRHELRWGRTIRSMEPVGFALWFYSYSTFLSRPGLYLEDLFVRPAARGAGLGKASRMYNWDFSTTGARWDPLKPSIPASTVSP